MSAPASMLINSRALKVFNGDDMRRGKNDREKVLEFLRKHEGEKFTKEEIENETGVSITDIRTFGILEWIESDRYGNVYHYNGIRKYLSSLKTYFLITLGLYVIMSVIGYIFSDDLTFLWEAIKYPSEASLGYSNFELLKSIFWNNLHTTFLAVILGVIVGIVPAYITGFNGLAFGVAFSRICELKGAEIFLLGIMPHGIVELPTFLLSCTIGMKVGHDVIKGRPEEGLSEKIYHSLGNGLKLYIFFLVPLLLLAAFIEAYI